MQPLERAAVLTAAERRAAAAREVRATGRAGVEAAERAEQAAAAEAAPPSADNDSNAPGFRKV